jgi:hypothetical protein
MKRNEEKNRAEIKPARLKIIVFHSETAYQAYAVSLFALVCAFDYGYCL